MKKLLTLNNIVLLILLVFGSYFFLAFTKKVTPILIPANNINREITQEKFLNFLRQEGIFPENAQISDPKNGNGGEVSISLKKKDGSIEISWPEEFKFYSILIKNLGKTDKIDDNKTLLGFTADTPQNRYFSKTGPVVIERTEIEPPLIINSEFTKTWELTKKVSPLPIATSPLEFKKGEKYSVEIIFEKEAEDKIYIGLSAFTF